MSHATTPLLESRWSDADAAGLDEPGLLLYRSNLLGADKRITNFGGGNTSAKIMAPDPLSGEAVEVLWVKGSGGDVGTMTLDGFATLAMDKLEALRGIYPGPDREDAMVGLLPHCTFGLNPRAASIDTPLHAYLPYRHVDHMHPDAVIAIAATRNSRALTAEIFGPDIGWLPWRRPGFELGLALSRFAAEHPAARGVVLESHGLFTWADTAKACYETTLETINTAIRWFDARLGGAAAFGGAAVTPLPADARRALAARLMPEIRARISADERKIGHFDDSPAVLDFVCARDRDALAALGTSCPDHFLRTKIRPLVLGFDPASGTADALIETLDDAIAAYRADYAAYYARCRHPDSPAMRDPNAVVYLVPGLGMISFARDKATARIAAEFYTNAINVMRGASGVDTYLGLPDQEAFDIEYWLLEEAKLQRMPRPKSLAGRVGLVTGGAGGIGRAIAAKLMAEGACVVLADVDAAGLDQARAEFAESFGADRVRTVPMDVTAESAVIGAFAEASAEYGGLDIVVSNAGIASSDPIETTSVATWDRTMDILAKGYFLVSRETMRLMRRPAPRRRHRVHRLEERPCGLAQRLGLLHRQGGRDPSRPLPRAGGRGGRHQGQCGQSGCRAARLQDLDGRLAGGARRRLQHAAGGARRALPAALHAQAFGLPGGHCRGGLFPRLGPVGEVDRQHHQCRCRQRPILHPVRGETAVRPSLRGRARC